VQEVPTEISLAFVRKLETNRAERAVFLATLDGIEAAIDQTDGLRMTLEDGRIVHLRPSGNAPECRFYAEAASVERAEATLEQGLAALTAALRAG